ncbi:MAG: CocE/NonD family hydrolase [Planctomycetota bacterium]
MSRGKKTLLIFGGLSVLGIFVLLCFGWFAELPGERLTPGGERRNQAFYLPMRDDVRIAVELWLPAGLAAEEKIPAILSTTRFWRARQLGMGIRIQAGVGALTDEMLVPPGVRKWNDAGFASVVVDARGSGASFGQRPIEWSPDEIADLAEVVSWIREQDWSNGKVGAYGAGYEASSLELLMQREPDLLQAAALEYHDFDPQGGLIQPGGVLVQKIAELQDESLRRLDTNDLGPGGFIGLLDRFFSPGVKPVDGEYGEALLEEAIAQRKHTSWLAAVEAIEFRDDEFAESGLSLRDVSPAFGPSESSTSSTPLFVRAGWLDAGAVSGALDRFRLSDQPQELWIGPWSRFGWHDTDPFALPDREASPPLEEQFDQALAFLKKHLGEEATELVSTIHYRPLGGQEVVETDQWPPQGFEERSWFLGAESTLTETAPGDAEASDQYEVRFQATTDDENRWTSPFGLDIVYRNRAALDENLVVYDTAPFEKSVEIAGRPVVHLHLASSLSSGAMFAYLEAVSPSDQVIYLTEGILRFDWRREDPDVQYPARPPKHSGLRGDAAPITPGEDFELSLGLIDTAAILPAGYRLRLALAGHDASLFERTPLKGAPIWTVHRSLDRPSRIEIPMREISGE